MWKIAIASALAIVAARAFAQGGGDCNASDPDAAISGCTAIIESGTDDPNARGIAYEKRGLAYEKKGLHDRAIGDQTTAIAVRQSADAYVNRGIVYYRTREYIMAHSDFTKAIELRPTMDRAYYDRGMVFEALGRGEHAIEDYRAALRINPGHQAARQRLAALRASP
jgi:tetratricopeptide (TPR) repeat protein